MRYYAYLERRKDGRYDFQVRFNGQRLFCAASMAIALETAEILNQLRGY